jgi:hypothetical protein
VLKPKGKWHREYTHYDAYLDTKRAGDPAISPQNFYSAYGLKLIEARCDKQKEFLDSDRRRALSDILTRQQLMLSEYIFIAMGRPRWFISKEMLELLTDVEIDVENLSNIHFPHDAMFFIFERGCVISVNGKALNLRAISISLPRSQKASQLIKDITKMHADFTNEYSGSLCMEVHYTEKDDDNTAYVDQLEFHGGRAIDFKTAREMGAREFADKSSLEYGIFLAAIKIISTAFLYRAARPELFVQTILDSESRQNQASPRDNMYKILTPEAKIVRAGESAHTEGTKRPHWRGWVLRTLRHERFTRNADGTFKVVLVPPCTIHGGE